MLPEAPRVDPRIRRTLKLIQQAFLALLREKPYSEIAVQDIAREAGINRATFYAHYPDKTVLFQQTIETHFSAALGCDQLNQLGRDDLQKVLRAVCLFMGEVHEGCHRRDEGMERVIEGQVQAQLHRLFLPLLLRNHPRPGAPVVSPEMVAMLLAGSVHLAGAHWARQEPRPPLEKHVSESLVFVWGGFASTGYA